MFKPYPHQNTQLLQVLRTSISLWPGNSQTRSIRIAGPWKQRGDEACIPVERPLYGKGFDGSGEAGTWMSFFHVWKWSASWFITFPTKTAVLDFGVLRQSLIYHIPDIPVCFTLPHPHVTSLALSKIQHSIPASDIFRSQLPWYLIYTFFEGEHDGLTQDRACQ